MSGRRPTATRRAVVAGLAGLVVGGRAPNVDGGQGTPAAGEREVEKLVASLPLGEKVARLFVVGAAGTAMAPEEAAFLERARPGGVILLGPNVGLPAEVAAYVAAIKGTNLGLPPLVAVDQEGGLVARLPGDPAPGAPELGGLPDADVRALSRARAAFVASFGFDVNFAPVADVAYAPESVMAGRAFGSDPALVAAKVAAAVEGGARTGVRHAAKHFPGHGRAAVDSHLALPEIDLSRDEWSETDALPFRAAVAAGVPMVMLGHLRYPRWDAAPATVSAVAVDVLREELGFEGVVVTDDLGSGMAALGDLDPLDVIDRAIAAGVDLLLFATPSLPPEELIGHLVGRVERGEVSAARIEASLRRVLRLGLAD